MEDDRIRWYHVPLNAKTLAGLTRRSDAKGLAHAGAHLLLVLGTGLLCWWAFRLQP